MGCRRVYNNISQSAVGVWENGWSTLYWAWLVLRENKNKKINPSGLCCAASRSIRVATEPTFSSESYKYNIYNNINLYW